MGIKDFSKAFAPVKKVKFADMKNKTIAIDAMTELYRSALGAKSVSLLTDKYGNNTLHITVILANIIEMQKNNVSQMWVFDHPHDSEVFHNQAKVEELQKRQARKDIAQEKLDKISMQQNNTSTQQNLANINANLDGEVELGALTDDVIAQTKEEIKHAPTVASLEKQTFSVSKQMIDDVKFMFDCLNIRYIEAPVGFEGEQIAAYLSASDQVDAVYSGDTDPIPFGAKVLYRRARDKEIYKYTITNIIKQIATVNKNIKRPTIDTIRTACVVLGCDFAPKTPRVGPKSVLKVVHEVRLTEKQKAAIEIFKKEPTEDIAASNLDKTPFVNCNVNGLIDWLVSERSFSRTRITTQLSKVIKVQIAEHIN